MWIEHFLLIHSILSDFNVRLRHIAIKSLCIFVFLSQTIQKKCVCVCGLNSFHVLSLWYWWRKQFYNIIYFAAHLFLFLSINSLNEIETNTKKHITLKKIIIVYYVMTSSIFDFLLKTSSNARKMISCELGQDPSFNIIASILIIIDIIFISKLRTIHW